VFNIDEGDDISKCIKEIQVSQLNDAIMRLMMEIDLSPRPRHDDIAADND
jgi:hypothetical protein